MQTKILKSTQKNEAVDLLKNGEIVALPTETVYGLGADAKNNLAINKIFIAKNRPSDHPLIVHIATFREAEDWAEKVPLNAKVLAESFWPGPLTMILHKKEGVSDLITGGLNTIALRIPNHPVILSIIDKLGNGIVAPSANTHTKTSPTKAKHVLRDLEGKISAVVDGGSCGVGIESTIIDMTKEVPVILRPGAITSEMIQKVLGIKIALYAEHNERVPGNINTHYQPEKPLFLLSIEEMEIFSQKENRVAIMHYSKIEKRNNNAYYKMPRKKSAYGKALYAMLHRIDNTNLDKIFVEKPPCLSEWSDINDRLTRAASKKI